MSIGQQKKTVLLRATERIQKDSKLLLLLSGVNKTTFIDPNFYRYCLCGNIEIITEKKGNKNKPILIRRNLEIVLSAFSDCNIHLIKVIFVVLL